MNINQEIRRIVEYQNTRLPKHDRKSKEFLEGLISKIIDSYKNKTYNFRKLKSFSIKQGTKKRRIKMFERFTTEEILCIFLKRELDRTFHIKYPNRNAFMRSTFDIVSSLKNMNDFVIFKFDFLDFFNSISSEFVLKKYIEDKIGDREFLELLNEFVSKTKYAYAGLNTSNIICEIVAKEFDNRLWIKLAGKGVIFYKRYIDDGLIIFNRFIEEEECKEIINKVIEEIFYSSQSLSIKQCRTKLNEEKLNYIARRNLDNNEKKFNFLGYEFAFYKSSSGDSGDGKLKIKYGITTDKIKKYNKRINSIVKAYVEKSISEELLRHQIKAFSHRTVYMVNHYKSVIWKSKGFISNYCELRDRTDNLTGETENFLKESIIRSFSNNGINPPYFIRCQNKLRDQSIYSLYNNLKNNKTLLFVEKIGINFNTLKKMCMQVEIDTNNKTYDDLVREYLIKVKVGH